MKTATRIMAAAALWAASAAAGTGKPKSGKPFAEGGPRAAIPHAAKVQFEEADAFIVSLAQHLDKTLRKDSPKRSVMVVDWQGLYAAVRESWESRYSAGMEAMAEKFGQDKQWTPEERAVRRYYSDQRDRTGKALDHVFAKVGVKLVTWKWLYNVKMAGMQGMIDWMPPVIKKLKDELQQCQNLLASADEHTRKARYGDSPSVGMEECRQAERDLDVFVRMAKSVARTIKIRRLGWALYRKMIAPSKLEAELKKAKRGLLSEELVPEDALPLKTMAILGEWDHKLPQKWIADFHARHQKAVEVMLPLIQGSGDGLLIYADMRDLAGRSLDDLPKPAEFRRPGIKKLRATLLAKKLTFGEVKSLREFLAKRAKAAKAEAERTQLKNRFKAVQDKYNRASGKQKAELGTKIEQIRKSMTMRDTLYEGLTVQQYSWDQLAKLGKDLKAGKVTPQNARQTIEKIRSEQDAMNKRARSMIRDEEDTIARLIEEAEKIE